MITASIEIRIDGKNELIDGRLECIPRLNDYVIVARNGEKETYIVRGVSHLISCGADDAPSLITAQGVVVTVEPR